MSRSADSNCNAFNNGTLLENSMGFVGYVPDSFDGTKDRNINWGGSSALYGGNRSQPIVMSSASGISSLDRQSDSVCGDGVNVCPIGETCENGVCVPLRMSNNVTNTPQNARDTAKPCSCSCNSCIESGHSGSRCNCSTGKCCDGQRAMARTPKRFDGNNPTFPKGGSYFDGNNRMRSGRDVSNGGLKLR